MTPATTPNPNDLDELRLTDDGTLADTDRAAAVRTAALASRRAEKARIDRDIAIAVAVKTGATLREVARACGISHTTVANIASTALAALEDTGRVPYG